MHEAIARTLAENVIGSLEALPHGRVEGGARKIGVSWAAMTDLETKQTAELLGKIELTLAQMLDSQRERTKSEIDWFANDIRLREEQIKGQRALMDYNRAAQRSQNRAIFFMGMLAAVMLVIGIGMITEPWWMPLLLA